MHDCRQFWVEREIPEGRACLWRLGSVKVWLARAEEEWAYAVERGGGSDALEVSYVPHDVVPGNLDWRHAGFVSAPRVFALRPCVPDRPIWVRFLHPLVVAGGRSAVFYGWFPASIELLVGTGQDTVLLGRVESARMKGAWVGTAREGRWAFAAPAPAGRELPVDGLERNAVAGRFSLINESDAPIEVDNCLLDFRYSPVFAGANHLWASSADVRLRGDERCARVAFSGEKPETETGARELARPAMEGAPPGVPLDALVRTAFHLLPEE